MKKNENKEILPKELLEKYAFTAEEIELLKDADALCDTADMLPDDADKFIDKIVKEFPDDYDGAWKKFAEIMQKDPKFFAQIIALNEISNSVSEDKPAIVQKLSTEQIKSKTTDEIVNDLMAKLGYKKNK